MAGTILSLVLVFAISLFAIMLVLNFGKPLIDTAKSSSEINDAEVTMKFMDNYLREVAREGNGSARKYSFTAPKRFEALKEEDAVVFGGETFASLFDFNMRTRKENLLYIAGSDVTCKEADGNSDGVTDLIIENTFVRFAFNKTARATPYSGIDTNYAMLNMTEKTNGVSIIPVNSSIHIDDNSSSSYGIGYSELSRSGSALPFCTVHFFVNATAVSYDVYYRLYAGADFLSVSVRNIR